LYLAKALRTACLKYCFHLWGYVFMPEHVHLLVWPYEEGAEIEEFLRAVKQSVSRKATNYLRGSNPDGLKLLATGREKDPYRFWQDGPGYDRNVTSPETLHYMLDYLHGNPVRRGLAVQPEEWKWSSVREWLQEGSGPIPLNRDSFPAQQEPRY
jgi:putative transposase